MYNGTRIVEANTTHPTSTKKKNTSPTFTSGDSSHDSSKLLFDLSFFLTTTTAVTGNFLDWEPTLTLSFHPKRLIFIHQVYQIRQLASTSADHTLKCRDKFSHIKVTQQKLQETKLTSSSSELSLSSDPESSLDSAFFTGAFPFLAEGTGNFFEGTATLPLGFYVEVVIETQNVH